MLRKILFVALSKFREMAAMTICAGARRLNQSGVDDGRLSFFRFETLGFDLTTAFSEKVIIYTRVNQCIAEPTMGRLIGDSTMQVQSAK